MDFRETQVVRAYRTTWHFHDIEGGLTVPDRPTIAIGDLLVVGSGIRAVVAWVRARGAPLGDCVAVYLDSAKNARYGNVQWTGTQWEFVREPPAGHDAHEVPALRPLIRKLRREACRSGDTRNHAP
jgi:hypothetical protein